MKGMLAARCAAVGAWLVLFIMAAPSPAGSIVEGLVGYWPCDEGRGDRAANLMGENGDLFGSTGDATAPGLQWAAGRFGRAIHLTGKGVTVQPMEALHVADAVTVSAWVKLDELRANALIFTREMAYRLGLDPAGKGHVRWQLNAGGKWAGNWLLGKTALHRAGGTTSPPSTTGKSDGSTWTANWMPGCRRRGCSRRAAICSSGKVFRG